MSTPINPAVEYVRNLPIEDQEAILADLLRKMIEIESPSQFFKVASEDEVFGYFLTPEGAEAQFQAFGPKLTPEDEAEYERRLQEHDAVIQAELNRLEDEERIRTRLEFSESDAGSLVSSR